MREECFFSFFQADGVDDGFPLQTFQAGGDNLPFGRVYHYRNPINVGLGDDEIQEVYHLFAGIEHGIVHVDVDDLCAGLDLFACDVECFGVVLFVNEPQEFAGTCHVTAFAYVDEIVFGADNEIFEPGLPKTVTVSSEETEEALKEPTLQIVEAVHSVLEKTPPELAADVADRGIVLTGGGSLLRGLEELIEDKTGINTMTAEEPMTCVAVGTGKFVEFLSGKRDDD